MMPALTPTVHGQSEYGRQVIVQKDAGWPAHPTAAQCEPTWSLIALCRSYLAAQQAAAAAAGEGVEGPTSPPSESPDIFPMSPDGSAPGANLAAEKVGCLLGVAGLVLQHSRRGHQAGRLPSKASLAFFDAIPFLSHCSLGGQ